jgi:glycosyltransferase involved in cell wall biosynthesis
VPYVPVCQYNTDYEALTDLERTRARTYFSAAAAIAFVADANRDAAERLLACRLPRATAIQNPVTVQPRPLAWPAAQTAEFACVARLDAGAKGQDILLEALAADRWRSRNWRLTFYGTGTDVEWLQALTRHFGLGERVSFAGHVHDIEEVWRRHHVLLLPSRAEGTPLSLLEAMALARPSVVTDVGGNRAWVVPGETGFVAAAPSTVALRAALEDCWQARDRWMAMGLNAHDLLIKRYDPTPGRTLLDLLQQSVRAR